LKVSKIINLAIDLTTADKSRSFELRRVSMLIRIDALCAILRTPISIFVKHYSLLAAFSSSVLYCGFLYLLSDQILKSKVWAKNVFLAFVLIPIVALIAVETIGILGHNFFFFSDSWLYNIFLIADWVLGLCAGALLLFNTKTKQYFNRSEN